MLKKAYIAVSFSKRDIYAQALMAIKETLLRNGILPLVFVEEFQFSPQDEKQMMQQAMDQIDTCDILLAETSDKGIGIGIEVGYAKAKGKPVVYLREQKAEHSTTTAGISDYQIIYTDIQHLTSQLQRTLDQLHQPK